MIILDLYKKYQTNEEIVNFLQNLSANWGDTEISPDNIQYFITNNLKTIANQQNAQLHDLLMGLSDRISEKWNSTTTNNLAFTIMGIAKGVFVQPGAANLPNDMWAKVMSHVPPDSTQPRIYIRGRVLSGLDNMYPSKQLKNIAEEEENAWVDREHITLRKYGCTSAKDAVNCVIQHKLKSANLKEFPDLEDGDLKNLFEMCPNLTQLSFKSDHITSLPLEAKNLQKLICFGSKNLKNLPEKFPEMKIFDCVGCTSLEKLPKLPIVEILNCRECSNLRNLPDELPLVKTLNIWDCREVENLPVKLLHVEELYCNHCSKLKSLPDELPKLQQLYIHGCGNLPIPKAPANAVIVR